ncbi:hypothetical protein ACJIZ3_003750 [Penstemon smallii]|uniref:Uncharacterized protein n=1 Tax=Penstemon smallii TaxID=265156 RepID=A0ABD3UA26_9LAMI
MAYEAKVGDILAVVYSHMLILSSHEDDIIKPHETFDSSNQLSENSMGFFVVTAIEKFRKEEKEERQESRRRKLNCTNRIIEGEGNPTGSENLGENKKTAGKENMGTYVIMVE